jgi:hypothetical protein
MKQMPDQFVINHALLAAAREKLASHPSLVWIVGGAGSGKTTICRALSAKLKIQSYDMDAHIYGEYHSRFSPTRHPVNTAWAIASNGLAWLLDMPWDDFNHFNQATLPEYLDLLTEDLDKLGPDDRFLIDGGISNPRLLAQAIPSRQIVCLSMPGQSSAQIWEESGERVAMKEAIYELPNPEAAWRKFLEFDRRLTATILQECQETGIPIYRRDACTIEELAERVLNGLGIW